MQRAALSAVIADAIQLQKSLSQAQALGLAVPLLPTKLTVKQRAVLEHIQAHYPIGLSDAMCDAGSRENLGNDLAVEILDEKGLCMSGRTAERTLIEWGLMPETAAIESRDGKNQSRRSK